MALSSMIVSETESFRNAVQIADVSNSQNVYATVSGPKDPISDISDDRVEMKGIGRYVADDGG